MHMSVQVSEVEQILAVLGRFPAWSDVPRAIILELANHARPQYVGARRPLFMADRPADALYLVKSGEFKITLISSEGREQILYLADTGKLITESFSPVGSPTHCAAFARVDSEAWEFPLAQVRAQMQQCPELAMAVLESHTFRTNRHIDLIYQLSLLSVEKRLAFFILELSRRAKAEAGKPFILPRAINVSTVACLLGTVREEVTRAQTRLQKKGIVDINRRELIVHDLDALEAMVNE